MTNKLATIILLGAAAAFLALPAKAQDAGSSTRDASQKKVSSNQQPPADNSGTEDADQLRKEAQNPVASLISVPIQENFNFNIQPNSRVQNVMNIQPVIPIKLNENWNLISRIITPVVYQPVNVPQTSGPAVQNGYYSLGDMQPTFFVSPARGKIIWGLGPQFLLPTATKTGILGQGKFGIGPTGVLAVQPGKWTLGILVNNVWSVAGHRALPTVNAFLLQYFINYNLNKGWYLTWQPTITANWEMINGGRWVVPLGGGLGRIMKLGPQPVNLALQFFGSPVHPPAASSWTLRFQVAFLYPKKQVI
jgi:hypothetical protein